MLYIKILLTSNFIAVFEAEDHHQAEVQPPPHPTEAHQVLNKINMDATADEHKAHMALAKEITADANKVLDSGSCNL